MRFQVAVVALALAGCGGRPADNDTLLAYVPEARCADAKFDMIERSDSIQDWRYVVRISGSPDCVTSLRQSLDAKGATASDIPLITGLLLPGHTNSEQEAVAFDFEEEPGAVIWTRDKT